MNTKKYLYIYIIIPIYLYIYNYVLFRRVKICKKWNEKRNIYNYINELNNESFFYIYIKVLFFIEMCICIKYNQIVGYIYTIMYNLLGHIIIGHIIGVYQYCITKVHHHLTNVANVLQKPLNNI